MDKIEENEQFIYVEERIAHVLRKLGKLEIYFIRFTISFVFTFYY